MTSTLILLFYDNYQPYGQDIQSTGTETYKFTGKPFSSATGLYYYYHRWYDQTIGRFISVDPRPGSLSSPQSLNPYVYVSDSPVNKIDPTGEWGFDSLVSWVSNAVKPVANTVSSIG